MDELTGLCNKASIVKTGREEFSRARRYRRPLSFMMIDLDLFKAVNDTYGHMMGDLVLKRVGYVISAYVREQDKTGRFGGEEFLVMMPETELSQAVQAAERLNERIRAKGKWSIIKVLGERQERRAIDALIEELNNPSRMVW
jgi:diguanylate cyclase (GGDEF)-like protein